MIYIIQYKGMGEPKLDQIREELTAHHAKIIDGSALPKMAKIEVQDEDKIGLVSSLSRDWAFYPERSYKVPTTRRRIKR
jgi:hypothetical protein